MTLEQLMASIDSQISALRAAQAAGADVSAALSAAESQKANVGAQIAATSPTPATSATGTSTATIEAPVDAQRGLSPEAELQVLRDRERQRLLEAAGRAAAEESLKSWREQQQADAAVIAAVTRAELAKGFGSQGSDGTTDIDEVVRRVMKEQRGPSRYVGQDATAAGAEQAAVASLGGVAVADGGSVRVGDHQGVKAIREAKNMAHFMKMLADQRMGKELSDAERGFLRECQQKAMAESTDTAGGYLIHPEWMPDILGLLRSAAVVRAAGIRTIGFSKSMAQTAISSGSTAYYHLENAHVSPSELTLTEAPLLTPKNLTGLVPVSNFLLGDAPEADQMVRDDLVEVIALREDLSFLQGTGSAGEPRGMKNMTGRTLDPLALGANGGYLSLPQTRQIRNTVRAFNSRNPRWHYFFPPQLLSHLEGLTDADGRFLVDTSILTIDGNGTTGRFDGIPFSTTTQIPVNITTGTSTNTTYILLVDLNELIIGDNKTLELAVSTEATYTTDGGTTWVSAFQAQQTLFRAGIRHDIAHRRPNHVIVQTGVRV